MKIKTLSKKLISLLLAVLIAASVFAGVSVTAGAAETTYSLKLSSKTVEVKTGDYSVGVVCNYNKLYKVKDSSGNVYSYFYNYTPSKIDSYLKNYEDSELSSYLRKEMKNEKMYAEPCSGYFYDENTKFGFAYNTECHKSVDREKYYTTRVLFFQIITDIEVQKSVKRSDNFISSGSIKAIGYFTSTTAVTGAQTRHTVKPFISSSKENNAPIISATPSHKNVTFRSCTKNDVGTEKVSNKAYSKLKYRNFGKFVTIATDAIRSFVSKGKRGL